MYEDFFEYGPYNTYQSDYDEYLDYNNDYNRFMTRQVNVMPYEQNYNDNKYINMYPEIYKKISPIIDKKLNSNNIIIDSASLDKITFEIYDEIANTDLGKKLNLKDESSISLGNNHNASINSNSNKISNQGMNKYAPSITTANANLQSSKKDNITKEASTKPARSNCLLCDLIKIMILNNLVGRSKPPRPGQNYPHSPNARSPLMQNERTPFMQEWHLPRSRYSPRPVFPTNAPMYNDFNMPNKETNNKPSYFDVPYPEDS